MHSNVCRHIINVTVFESNTLSSIVGLTMDSINKITFKKGQNSSYVDFILRQ